MTASQQMTNSVLPK